MVERKGTKALELWCKKMTEGYPGVKIDNMTTSWRDGLAFCAIIHHFRPELIDFPKLNKDDIYQNNEMAFRVAEQYLGIPALLEAEDMVEYEVPDRLSILTYLSQFYQVFTQQGSLSRTVPKRPATVPDRGIVTPASTSPPTKMSMRSSASVNVGIPRRKSCPKCSLPVFIAERLNVGKHIYHQACFRCARCNSQLYLENYYETETENQFCCKSCTDPKSVESHEVVITNSLSDEQKSELNMNIEDNLSASYEETYVDSFDNSNAYVTARSAFISNLLAKSTDDIPPDLPTSEPPTSIAGSSNTDNEIDSNDCVLPADSQLLELSVNKPSVNDVSDSNQLESASHNELDNNSFVTKEIVNQDIDLVQTRMRLYEEAEEVEEEEENLSVPSKLSRNQLDISIDNSTVQEQDSDTSRENKKEFICSEPVIILDDSDSVIVLDDTTSSDVIIINEIDDSKEGENNEPLNADNVLVEAVNEAITKNFKTVEIQEEYPEDLNPFGDEDEHQNETKNGISKEKLLNPFSDDEDEEEGDIRNIQPPKPALRTIPILKMSSGSSSSAVDTPEFARGVKFSRISIPPEQEPYRNQNTSLNPFSSDDDESEETIPTPSPKPRKHTFHVSSPYPLSNKFGSITSLSSTASSITSTRKKKPAPRPPIPFDQNSPQHSYTSTSSPSTSVNHSPKPRKNRKAPLPPTIVSSTPMVSDPSKVNLSESSSSFTTFSSTLKNTVLETETTRLENLTLSPTNSVESDYEKEKVAKDELNRSKQQHKSHKSNNERHSYGKWKRKKGQAPLRPILQKRTIKALPMVEVQRELETIEIQLHGLEKQGVRLEHIIRERCEGPNTNPNDPVSEEADELILQLFDVVNEKNELCRRRTELIYLQKEHKLEEQQAEIEYEIRRLMIKSEATKTDTDKEREEELINRLVEIVERRNEMIECLEMDRVREAAEDDSIYNSLCVYASKRDSQNTSDSNTNSPKKKEKKTIKKKFKLKHSHKIDVDKDVDESESSNSATPVKDKKKKKFNIF